VNANFPELLFTFEPASCIGKAYRNRVESEIIVASPPSPTPALFGVVGVPRHLFFTATMVMAVLCTITQYDERKYS
jgi:hypothetical protein